MSPCLQVLLKGDTVREKDADGKPKLQVQPSSALTTPQGLEFSVSCLRSSVSYWILGLGQMLWVLNPPLNPNQKD